MNRRSFFTALASLAVVLLVIAGTSFYGILAQSPLKLLSQGGVMANPQAAIFVPRQAPAMISLLVNPLELEGLRQLEARPGERSRSRNEIERIKNSLLSNTNLNYRQDIRPWLGDEITFAVTSLDYDRNPDNGSAPGYLLAASIKDGERAREFLQLYFAQSAIAQTSDLVFEQYKGVNLIYRRSLIPGENNSTLASAVVGNEFILFGNSPQVIKTALNDVQVPDLNLENAPAYQNALQAIQESKIGVGFVNLPAVAAWTKQQQVPEDYDWEQMLTLTLTVNPQGLVAETALTGVGAAVANRKPTLNEPVTALNYIPSNSGFTAAGKDLNQLWQDISAIAADNPIQSLLDSSIAQLDQQLGLDLATDIFSWVQGEYALSFIPNADQSLDWVFVTEKNPEAEIAITNLDKFAKNEGYSVGKLPLDNQDITAWTKLVATTEQTKKVRLNAQVQGVHTQVDNYEIFATSIEGISAALASNPLLNNQRFQAAIAPLATENDGYVYLDWQKSQAPIEKSLGLFRVLEIAGKPFFDHLDTVTLSSRGSKNGVRRGTIFFDLY